MPFRCISLKIVSFEGGRLGFLPLRPRTPLLFFFFLKEGNSQCLLCFDIYVVIQVFVDLIKINMLGFFPPPCICKFPGKMVCKTRGH